MRELISTLDRLAERRTAIAPRAIHRLHRKGLLQQRVQAVDGARCQVDGRWLLNFTSTNYLGLNQHPLVLEAVCQIDLSAGRRSLFALSLGAPRLLATDPFTDQLEAKIAELVGQEDAVIFPSTTHVALDLLPLLAGQRGALFVDARAYPISSDGAKLAARQGARLRRFAHNDLSSLAQQLHHQPHTRDKIIVCDGVYAAGGGQALLRDLAALAAKTEAVIYVDDAHGLGVLGRAPTNANPYGIGGGGTLAHQRVPPGNVVHVGSLSKAFGVPVAFAAGPKRFVDFLRDHAPSHVHSSPPALPVLAAALAALGIHETEGDALRRRLLRNVRRFRHALAAQGVSLSPTLFPIQSLYFNQPREAEALAYRLRRAGVWSVLQFAPVDFPAGAALRFVLTALHRRADIHAAAGIVATCLEKGTLQAC